MSTLRENFTSCSGIAAQKAFLPPYNTGGEKSGKLRNTNTKNESYNVTALQLEKATHAKKFVLN